ncbi:subtilisin-like serine protease [Purpureocillium lavendulum]|uniref:Subtilisin-like serine protease n=1 Tax=Purpureocillium lavendulum TaxID=1247861 RepID=A0AB34FC79_9HYPO|nr:subtilisin-like serine protease [Purpureocillium lavendulum]
MSTIVFMARLKSKLRPMPQGLRCTPHRIFLASLILAGKLLNDHSPANKYWAGYSSISTGAYTFGFNCTEVNLMEKQLLFLLEWKLHITEHDLYRKLDVFLKPIRVRMVEEVRMQEAHAAITRFPGSGCCAMCSHATAAGVQIPHEAAVRLQNLISRLIRFALKVGLCLAPDCAVVASFLRRISTRY